MNKYKTTIFILFLLFFVYLFLFSINLMEAGLKLKGKGLAENLIAGTTNPFVGLFIGILATAIVQSSSCTTSITVALVASEALTIRNAVPIIMGANIGTTVTNTLVSLAHIHKREEIKTAFSGATVHDIFNLLTVTILFPLQIKWHILENIAKFLTKGFEAVGGIKLVNPIKVITSPIIKPIKSILHNYPIIIIILGVLLLFIALIFIIKLTRNLVATKIETYLHKFIFKSMFRSWLAGLALTATIQSSSVTTSIVIPLVGTGILTVEQIFPYTMGANIGTTVTALLASFATGVPSAITIAFCHTIFNIVGNCIFFPLRIIPIKLSKSLGGGVAKYRVLAFVYVVIVFFLIPIILLFIYR